MDTAQQSGAVEGGEVAADGLGGDLEPLGEGEHVDPSGFACEAQDLLLALGCVHVGLHPFDARLCDLASDGTHTWGIKPI